MCSLRKLDVSHIHMKAVVRFYKKLSFSCSGLIHALRT